MSEFDVFSESTPDWWDDYSCQPYKLSGEQKRRTRIENLSEYLKVAATNVTALPAIAYQYARLTPQYPLPELQDFAGLSISTDHANTEQIRDLVAETGVKNILIRAPSWQTEDRQLDRLCEFIASFTKYDLTVNILQSTQSCQDSQAWQQQVQNIISRLRPYCHRFQIGNAVNRSKWGCRHSGDALDLFDHAHAAIESIEELEILGSSIIDFEPLLSLRTLLNGRSYKMHHCASQLYVNRRGSPHGKQYRFFDLNRKIKLISAMLALSNRCDGRLWITETNWPLLDTKPYTPNSGHPRSTVNEQTQAEYLLEYFKIARETGLVDRCYWWQLINPGYGLIDHRSGSLRKMPAFHAFKELCHS